MKRTLLICVFLVVGMGVSVWAEEFDITFVGTVESSADGLMVRVDEVLATAAEDICSKVKVISDIEGISAGDKVHVKGFYDPVNCMVTVEAEDHFVYRIPAGAELEKLSQSLQCTGKILRIYEMRGETFCDISVEDVLVVTFQGKEMCTTVTVKMKPVVGEVEEGLEPGDEVEFSGTYDEKSCMGSLGWHDDYLRKKKRAGVSWVLIVGGFVGYLMLRKVW
ncbi:MAG: hypothetical protein AYK19_07550 [Theionarchaea archaeon DG-70-1]|nr:MAG: hypothetical protein AYK19_07550 [Theionarchaea archaeon DG-70-1]